MSVKRSLTRSMLRNKGVKARNLRELTSRWDAKSRQLKLRIKESK